MNNLYTELVNLLSKDERLTSEGKLLKNKVVEFAYKLDKDLVKLLLSNPKFKELFFLDVDGVLVFNQSKFQTFISNKEFLPDSFTSFKNKIGLTNENGEFISQSKEVVLSFPYKDCVLEGGQDKEDAKRDEIFYNKILASDEIDRLFEPKVLTNFRKFDKDGEHTVNEISENDNLIIKGNNLIALHSLKKTYAGKVKLIYIDPPYNTGNDGFNYNDAFNHSTWLTFIQNRIEIAKELLSKQGTLWINIDDNESHYLKVLCDGIFGRHNFVTNIIWKKKYSPQNDAKYFSDMHDNILVFAREKESFKLNLIPRTEEMNARYKNLDNDSRGDWKPGDFSVKTYSANYDYSITLPSGRVVNPPKSRSWRTSKENFEKLVSENRIWFGSNGDSVPSIKRFLTEVKEGTPPQTIWDYSEVGHNQDARKEILDLFKNRDVDFATPKPERLLERIIHIASNEGDLILDFFAGSGTTGAVAHKMKRRYLLIEQMDYIKDLPEERLRKVIQGEQGGISKNVGWNGGGSFIYFELKKSNENFINSIKDSKDLLITLRDIKQSGFLTHKVDLEKLEENEFVKLSESEQRKLLMEILDANHLYVNLNDIDDSRFKVSEEDKRLNKQFYSI